MIKADSLVISYQENIIINKLSFQVSANNTLVVKGKNGTGKSTLLKTIAGFMPYEGQLELSGKISYLGHNTQLYTELTIEENLEIFLTKSEISVCKNYLKKFDVTDDKKISELSKGTQRKVALAIALSREHDIIILDEPTSNLDVDSQNTMIDILNNLSSIKIISSHEENLNKLGTDFITL